MNGHIKGSTGVSTMLRVYCILGECQNYIDLILKEIDGFSPGEKGRYEVACVLPTSLRASKEREPLNSPIVMIAKYINQRPSPVQGADVYHAMRKLQLPSSTICSILARYQWKRLTDYPLQKRAKKEAPVKPLPIEKTLPIPHAAPITPISLPVEIQDSAVKSILLEVAGVKITISYEGKNRK